eukprot:TRINITY_DN79160_c0_g1_i1.p1 TRINITY_DN79160_c0_g1~~TRINITY_DN79160_c0_g1_i1.p1  ORF type:complete len:295 (-),score=57.04 TRINITY_DN79160_c0_g1_i1:203-1087(-)
MLSPPAAPMSKCGSASRNILQGFRCYRTDKLLWVLLAFLASTVLTSDDGKGWMWLMPRIPPTCKKPKDAKQQWAPHSQIIMFLEQPHEAKIRRRGTMTFLASALLSGLAAAAQSVWARVPSGYGSGGSMSADDVQKAASSLTDMQRKVLLQAGTERPFTGQTVNGYPWNTEKSGTYVSAISGKPLFSTCAKYDSGTGWPSFWAPISAENVLERIDPADQESGRPPYAWRVEVLDRASMTHLGHVFDDGPKQSGKRYCMNAAALKFVPGEAPAGDAKQVGPWRYRTRERLAPTDT